MMEAFHTKSMLCQPQTHCEKRVHVISIRCPITARELRKVRAHSLLFKCHPFLLLLLLLFLLITTYNLPYHS